ncbi:MAG: 23S rRNA (uracil-5-)-methyltransferase RumA [Bacteroidetes bacterium CG2_30_33_31]|nr:MAG: 23S rRNA (uracil-5-)-methyltransferase RumA [Bacteroidetes bacterium CG2_30_33_31]
MRRSRRILPKLENVEIIDAGAEGKAVGRVNDKVVFIPYAVPGDIVNVQVTKKKKSYLEARILDFIKYSDLRIDAECEHFGICGGCKWQHLKYEDQLRFKQKQVFDALTRIAKIDATSILPIIGNKEIFFYRNKLEFTFSNFKWLTDFSKDISIEERNLNALGFHIPNMFDRILDIEKCYLQSDPSNEIRLAVRDYSMQNKFEFYDIKNHQGFLRNLIIRTSTTSDLMVIVVFASENLLQQNALLQMLSDKFPQISSLMYVINEKSNDSITDQEVKLFSGSDYIFEVMGDLKFKIGPKSFYQTNSIQAHQLYNVVCDFANLNSQDVVYDLYTGTGTIANFIAKKTKKVIGIEYVEEAINDAKMNSKINNIDNTEFYAGDMIKVLNDEFVESHGKPDVIITDPPRAGMHPDVLGMLIKILPKKIVYVSCNPATQARDLELLKQYFAIIRIQPVDMFPQTAHVENVVLLEKI